MSSSVSCWAAVPTWRCERLSVRHSALSLSSTTATSALIKAEHRQRRNQHRRGQQKRRRALVERLHPKPEIKPDAAVNPGDDQDRVHQPHLVGPCDPEGIKHLRIELFLSEQRLAQPHAGDMGDDQRGDAETEHAAATARSLSSEIAGARRAPRSRDRHGPARPHRTRSRRGGIARTACGSGRRWRAPPSRYCRAHG